MSVANIASLGCGCNLFFSTNVEKGIREAEHIFVSVNTPTKKSGVGSGFAADLNNPPDFRGRHIVKDPRQSPLFHAVAESMRTILESNSKPNYRFNYHFNVLSNPEFLAEGTVINDLFAPDCILISLQTPEGKDACASLAGVYANCVPKEQILTVGLWSSELSKLAPNAMLAQRISFINALSAICETNGANICQRRQVRLARGAKIPLKASIGFGGSCFQKDIVNLVYLSESLRLPEVAAYWHQVVVPLLQARRRHVLQHHHRQSAVPSTYVAMRVDSPSLQRIAVLGFAFKVTQATRASRPPSRSSASERAFNNIHDPGRRGTDLGRPHRGQPRRPH
ncbi:UDP-glucose/GDP-mannose dehydrogenase family, central domain-containing protein [Mycena galericulata]|nr:UDP-glucose/GDP-mannose dehydrogenase family, central domain-containing protein [Mycena galericulata]